MSIYALLHNQFLAKSDIITTSLDQCVFCCFIYCCLPCLMMQDISIKKDKDKDKDEEYEDVYPENFFHMERD